MIRTVVLLGLVVVATVSPAQWERTGGPGGDLMNCGTVSPNGDIYILSQSMHRSGDDGATWVRVAPQMPMTAYNNPKVVWTKSGSMFMNMNRTLWKSTDVGTSWSIVMELGSYPDLAYSRFGQLVVGRTDSILVSTDDGSTWGYSKPGKYEGGAVAVDHDGVIYAPSEGYLYRSTNNGQSWMKILNGLLVTTTPKVMASSGPQMTLAGIDRELYLSTDSGRVWSNVYSATASIRFICPLNVDTVFLITNSNKIERSTDGGRSWNTYGTPVSVQSSCTGLFAKGQHLFILFYDKLIKHDLTTGFWVRPIVPNGKVPELCAGTSGSIYAVTPMGSGGRFWNFAESVWSEQGELSNQSVYRLAVDSSEIFYAIIGQQFMSSADKGNTWVEGIPLPGSYFRFALSDDMIYVSTNEEGVFRSSDRGATWDQLNSGIVNQELTAIGVSDNYVYTGGLATYYRSTNQGWTWEEPIFPFISGSGIVRAIECQGSNVILGVDLTGAYFSSDYGLTWENYSTGLALDSINQLLATPSGAVFAGTSSGAYEFDPVAKTWKNINDGMLTGPITSLALGKDGRVYAGTNGDGVYRTTKTYGTWIRHVKRDVYSPDDITIYPNPASTEVQIHFHAASPERYRIAICDLLGATKLVVYDESTVDVSALRNGQYFLRIISHDGIHTLPLSIAR